MDADYPQKGVNFARRFTAALQMNEEQHIERDQSPEREHLHREKVGACENGPVGTDELFPRCCVPALRGRRDAVAVEDIADRLIPCGQETRARFGTSLMWSERALTG